MSVRAEDLAELNDWSHSEIWPDTCAPHLGAPRKEVWEEVCLFLIFFHFTLSFLQGRSTVLWRPSDGVFLRKVLFVFSFVQFFLTWSKVFRWGFICGQGVAIRFRAQGCSYSVGRESGSGRKTLFVSKVKGLHSGSSQVWAFHCIAMHRRRSSAGPILEKKNDKDM